MNTNTIEQQGFQLIEQLSESSRTIVWKAVQTTLARTVALCILKPEAAADPLARDHFLKIVRRIARIKNDGLVSIFDIVSDGDLHYVVMEHVDGPSIEELIDHNGPLPIKQILEIALSVARAIDQMWSSEKIVHRNLKSTTIRLDVRGIAKITDFSLAILAEEGAEAYALDDGHVVGTPCFLSPEQAQGSLELNTFSDMYALGAVCYHMATGKPPFDDREVVAILNAHLHEQLPPPHTLNKHVPVDFSWFVRRLMVKTPELRYCTWDDAIKDILRQIAGETPLCVCPGDTSSSTISDIAETTSEASSEPSGPRILLQRNRKSRKLAAYQAKALTDAHALDVQRATRAKKTLLWIALALWLLLLFWYRAAYETAPEKLPDTPAKANESPVAEAVPTLGQGETPPITDKPSETPATAKPLPEPASTSVADAPPTPEPSVPTPVEKLPTMPSALSTALAQALADGELQRARTLLQADNTAFQQKDEIIAFLEQMPDPDSLVADYLEKQIGKPLAMEHNGVLRTVIVRGIGNGVIQLESGGRGAEMPIRRLTPKMKLRWTEKPSAPPALAAYCLTLLRSSRREEVYDLAKQCPPLSDLLTEAVKLAHSLESPDRGQ